MSVSFEMQFEIQKSIVTLSLIHNLRRMIPVKIASDTMSMKI